MFLTVPATIHNIVINAWYLIGYLPIFNGPLFNANCIFGKFAIVIAG